MPHATSRCEQTTVSKQPREVGTETVCRMRAMASLCRQSAAHHPDRSWKLLAEAVYWEHMASAAQPEHHKGCTANSNGAATTNLQLE